MTTDLDRVALLRHAHLLPLLGSHLSRYSPSFLPPSPFSTASTRHTQGHTLTVLSLPTSAPTLHAVLLAAGELRTDRAFTLLTQIVAGLEYLHSVGLVHRALRPAAVLVGVGGEVRLQDVAWWQRLVDLNRSEPWVLHSREEDLPDPWSVIHSLAALTPKGR